MFKLILKYIPTLIKPLSKLKIFDGWRELEVGIFVGTTEGVTVSETLTKVLSNCIIFDGWKVLGGSDKG